jgi:hypothetical protein
VQQDEIEMEQRGEVKAQPMVGKDHPQNIEDVESDQRSQPARHFWRNLLLGGALAMLFWACVGALVSLYTQVGNISADCVTHSAPGSDSMSVLFGTGGSCFTCL